MLIGLNGRKSAGKNTAGDYLATQGFELLSFAALLKDSAAELLGTTVEALEIGKNEEDCTVVFFGGEKLNRVVHEFTMRQFLQRYGTQAHREIFADDFWIEQMYRVSSLDPSRDYAITDARFDNELESVKQRGGFNIRIERPGLPDDGDTHASEADPSPDVIDYTVVNDGSLGDLYVALDEVLADIEIQRTLAAFEADFS